MSDNQNPIDSDDMRPSPIRLPKPDECCESPCDPPWRKELPCLNFFETIDVRFPLTGKEPLTNENRAFLEVQLVFKHALCLIGKQHGPLAYTFTLLPGEKMTLFHSDRFRRVTSEEARYSVQTTFSQFVSAVHAAQSSSDFSQLNDVLNNKSSSASGGGGGGINLFGLVTIGGGGSSGSSSNSSSQSISSLHAAASQFTQTVVQASQYTDLQRSITVSSYEDSESINVTSRIVQNDNMCRAVTYFVRKVVDVYVATTTLIAIRFRVVLGNSVSAWMTAADLPSLPAAEQDMIKKVLDGLPKIGESIESRDLITVPTDGVVYDPELAHCCTCDPEREEAIRIKLERERAEAIKVSIEARMMEQEVRRREMLLAAGKLDPFEPAPVMP